MTRNESVFAMAVY